MKKKWINFLKIGKFYKTYDFHLFPEFNRGMFSERFQAKFLNYGFYMKKNKWK